MLPLLYIDPGTGSLLIYALFGLTATFCFALRGFWYKLKSYIYISNDKYVIPKSIPDIVIHSEGSRYWQVFQPLLKELDRRGIEFAYVTPEKKDFKLASDFKYAVPVRPGKELATIAYMNKIKARLVLTTTPHLNVYMMKKSKKVGKYIYMFHAPTGIDVYEKYAFNHYDAIFCNNHVTGEQIRELEKKRNLPEKELFYTGCSYYDYMLEEREKLNIETNNKTILYAPTWGERSSILKYGKEILENLSDSDYKIIFRPHPQFYISHSDIIKDIEEFISKQSNIEYDKNQTAMESMAEAQIMIADNSGIIMDFAYIFQKPILYIDINSQLKGFEGEDLSILWNVDANKKLSKEINREDFSNLINIVNEAVLKEDEYAEQVRRFRDEELFNFGNSARFKADKIEELLKI